MRMRSSVSLFAVAALAMSSSCQHGNRNPVSVDPPLDGRSGGADKENGVNYADPVPPVEILFNEATGLIKTVYFDYNGVALRPYALETLGRNAEAFAKYPEVNFLIEGHCDERGTQEYNMALGDKRALVVREHLIRLGVSGDRMMTITHGEEMPADPGHDESAWAKNRRCEFNYAGDRTAR